MFFFQNIFHNLICYTQPANCRPNSHHGINGSNHQLSSIKSHVFSLIQRQFWPLNNFLHYNIYIYIYMSELLSDSYIWMLIRLRVHRMANLTDTCEDTHVQSVSVS